MKTSLRGHVRALAVLVLAVVPLGGCEDDEGNGSAEPQAATEALEQIVRYAPTGLPDNVPDALLQVTLGGTQYSLPDLLGRPSGTRPSARIVAAYQTVSTPAQPLPFGTTTTAIPPDYARSAPAAQVYECRQSGDTFAWSFLQPEAGLRPITTQSVAALETLSFDHFRYPGGIDYGDPTGAPAAGPAWRVSASSLVQGSATSGQRLFVGAVDVTVPNGSDNVPLLRLANTARIDRGLPSDVFSRTSSDGSQTGYVLRLDTEGGVAPTTGCAGAADVGKRERVSYAADYYFIDVFP